MRPAEEFQTVANGVFRWESYDPKVKTDLSASALQEATGLYLIDPIPLAPAALAELTGANGVAGILVTNGNHSRAAQEFAAKFAAPVFAHPAAREINPSADITASPKLAENFRIVPLPGAPAGEVAVLSRAHEGTLVIGDAVINFSPYGFAFLPPKYCENAKQMRRSLAQLLDFSFVRILFAHGAPLTVNAHARLAQLLRDTAG